MAKRALDVPSAFSSSEVPPDMRKTPWSVGQDTALDLSLVLWLLGSQLPPVKPSQEVPLQATTEKTLNIPKPI